MLIAFLVFVLIYLLSVDGREPRSSHTRAVRLKYLQEQLRALYERSHREQRSYLGQAILVSNRIKEEFPEYDWSSHTILLKHIAEPFKSRMEPLFGDGQRA